MKGLYMVAGAIFLLTARAGAQDYRSIEEALAQPQSKLFFIERTGGQYHMGDTASQYNGDKDFKDLTFDISNNKVLANMSPQGMLKNITMYRDSYFANCGPVEGKPGGWPGVWVAKDNSSFGPYCFTVQVNGARYSLDTVGWDFRTGLLDNLFPITELKAPDGYKVTLIAYAPLSPDGSKRIRGLIYGLLLQNTAGRTLTGSVHLPGLFANGRQNYKDGITSWAQWDPYDYEVSLGDAATSRDSVNFSLGKGQSVWVPAIFSMLGDSAAEQIDEMGTLQCLDGSWKYFRKLLGRLQTPGDPYLAGFYERQVMEIFGSLAMSASGKIAGANWGSYGTTRQVWMKDCFYSSLPFMQMDPVLARDLIKWFRKFGVRPKGTTQPGGVNHSVGLSVSSIILAAQYYEATGDKTFFLQNPGFRSYWKTLLEELIRSRRDSAVWLFPSRYISDGPIAQDYHTGSNVCAWKGLQGFARLLKEVYGDPAGAERYASIAGKVHDAIFRYCTIEGPYGRQFIEGSYRDGRKPQMVSDGEESDITLMPYYGFLNYDDPVYLNYMKFSMSKYNLIYEPKLHAITWFGVESTAPGYMKGICAGTGEEDLFGPHGYYSEVRKVTDADGSIWWWCYGWAKEVVGEFARAQQVAPYGQLVRGVPGKAGWFSGVHTAVFRTRFAGIGYDAPKNILHFAPFSPSSDLSWKDYALGEKTFNFSYTRSGVVVVNSNRTKVELEATIPAAGTSGGYTVTVNGRRTGSFQIVTYLGGPAVRVRLAMEPGEKEDIRVTEK